ncbi:hypothetical protein [Flammeovirga sp. SJP92]|uniref:hypothetical protein n=1 Tax=Flammeovirga sp. SJP92 TaxID=1775430 RepID=UPI000789112F|nr:hypothetical protein [Flammeovirga sp. SJP92]KXX66498.1 hypothetical protein AVL50_31725 [Flammeovirga sp. SJP92]
MTYTEKLIKTKDLYPFEKWRGYFYPNEEEDLDGMEQYTEENCATAQKIFEELIDKLIQIGEVGNKKDKEKAFETAIISLNNLNEETGDCLIETGEREDLCELIDEICNATGLNTDDYAEGDGIADLWREW